MISGMVVTKKSKTRNATQDDNDSKKVKKLVLMILSIGFILLVTVAAALNIYIKNEEAVSETKNKMTIYLHNKYNKYFEVSRPKLSGGGLDVLGTWEADAYPTDDKSMMFRIIKAENRDNFSDQYTAKIWSQRETARLNKIAQQNASNSKWKVNASVEIYLAEPLADTARPDNPKMENIIKQDHGLSYTVTLSYGNVDASSFDNVVSDSKRITDFIRKDKEVKNLNVDYLVKTTTGSIKKCSGRYYKSFDYSYDSIKTCLNNTNQDEESE